MPTAYIPTIVGAGATVAVTKAVFGRPKRKKEVSMARKAKKAKSKKRAKKCR
jgi:hypothetical protein